MKKLSLILILSIAALMVGGMVLAGGPAGKGNGFDEAGYNRQARIFVGTAWDWCMDKVGDETWCENYLGPYSQDRLLMKWNAEWDRGNKEGWTDPVGYDAWLSNEWNGKIPGGSDSVWHYRIKWDEGCAASGTPSREGGYCIWGQFVVLMDHGSDPLLGDGHFWFGHAIPSGYAGQ